MLDCSEGLGFGGLGLGIASGFQMDEVEEGEAFYYRDNSSVDPDRDLAYIDEKLQNVLGHFQKDFEGLVTSESLGAKFGDYGSFLPTYQRASSIWSHPKNPKDVQNFSSTKSLKVLPVEGASKDAAQSTRLGAAPHSLPSLNTSMAPSAGISDRRGTLLSSNQGKKPLVKEEPVTNKQANSSDQRTLKVRIKINSDKAAKNKAAIFSSFGLDTTPSSSMGNSEDSGMPSQCVGTLDESPSNIVQIMTSFPIPGSSPLSPLVDSLLSLEMREIHSQTSNPKAIRKLSKEKTKRVAEKSESTVISVGEIGLNLSDKRLTPMKPEVDIQVGNMKSETLDLASGFSSDKNLNPLSRKGCNIVDNKKGADMAPRVCKDAERNVSGKKLEVSKSRMEETLPLGFARVEFLESTSDHSGGDFEKRDLQSSSTEKISESRPNDYYKDESVDATRVQSKMNGSYTVLKADSDVSNCFRDLIGQTVVGHEKDEVKLPHGVDKSSSKGKKKSMRSRNSVDLASEAEGSLVSGSYEVPNRKEKSGKMCNLKSRDDTEMVRDDCKALQPEAAGQQVTKRLHNSPEMPLGKGASKSNRGVLEKRRGSSLNKSREISTQEDINFQLIPDPSLKESANDDNLSLQVGPVSVVEPTAEEPIIIEEDWVQCERCETWRLLPYGTKPEQLPEKWVCRMLNWLPGMNRCDFSEDDTTQALRRLYQPESQSNITNLVDRIVPGSSAAGLCLGTHHLNSNSNCTPNPPRMKQGPKEPHCVASNGGSVLIPGSVKSFQQDVVKSRSLTDLKQKFPVERSSHKHKEKHEKSGDAKENKLKSKRAADQYEYGTPKRTKVDAVSGTVKTTKKVPSSSIPEERLVQPGLLEMKTYCEKEISLKKRKLKDWQESQNCVGAVKNENKGLVKEEISDNEFRKVKKSTIANAEGKEVNPHKADEKLSIGKVTKLKNPVQCREEAFNLEMGPKTRKHKMKIVASNDVDMLNKDLGSEHLSRAAASSSSKVSDSFKSRSRFLEVRGSPVESVSSSPIRTSNLEQLSPARRDKLRKKVTKNGHIPVMDSAKKSLNVEDNTEIKKPGTSRRLKVPGFPTPDFRDNNNGQNIGGKSRVRGESPAKDKSVHLVKDESKNLENLRPGDLQLLDRCHSDDKSNKNLNSGNAVLREKSKKGSSLLSKGKDGSSGSNPEGIKKVPTRPNEMLSNSKGCLRDGVKTGPNHVPRVALLNGDSRDLKCRIKLAKDDRDDKPTRETPQQDPVQSCNDGVATGSDLTRIESIGGSSSPVMSNHVAPAQISSSIPCSHKGYAFDVIPADSSGSGDSLKVLNQAKNAASPLRNDASSQSCAAFKEAEELKSCGDRFKDSGFLIEGNEAYFQAVLHFLQAASLRENCNYDSNKHGEMSPMQIYSSTAKLCELCAIGYEERNELAAAALAYKCVEVAYMRVVYCKNSTLSRDRHDLQASLQIVPQGESPSSSASDVDSLNNLAMVDKAALSKSIGSHAGNHVITARNRPNFVRLLDFTKDVNSAMEASYKSQNTFAAAIRNSAQDSEGIVYIKRVIDLSFQDVDELVRLVRAATDSISRQGFGGNKD